MVKKVEKELSRETSDESRVYELGFLLDPAIDENELGKHVDAIKDIFKGKKAEFISENPAKLLDLSYTITKKIEGKNEKFDRAYFGWVKYEISQDEIENLDVELKNNESIIRFILIKTVRENTHIEKKRVSPRYSILSKIKKDDVEKKKVTLVVADKVSEEEMDKAIDELTKED